MTNTEATMELERIREAATLLTDLEETFLPTEDYSTFRLRVFEVLEAREARLKAGLSEQKGVALLGPAGAGKSRLVKEVIQEYAVLADATGGREFGSKIVSVIVPGRASIKDTCKEILRALEYPIKSSREEDYLFQQIAVQLEANRVAALHLDEVQDSGRYKTGDSMELFAKRFRNLMQDRRWPICLILSATLDAKSFINHDPTLTRRLRPVEMRPVSLASEGQLICETIEEFSAKVGLSHEGLLSDPEFLERLIHSGARSFGLVIEILLEALGEAVSSGIEALTVDHFADVYYVRTNCEDDMNPFVSETWRVIDTRKAMDRWIEESKNKKRRRPK